MFAKALKFLDDLQRHNDKVWFDAHRDRYERDVKGPSIAFVEMFAPRLAAISPHLQAVAIGKGRSISRIHRDTRFSSDAQTSARGVQSLQASPPRPHEVSSTPSVQLPRASQQPPQCGRHRPRQPGQSASWCTRHR